MRLLWRRRFVMQFIKVHGCVAQGERFVRVAGEALPLGYTNLIFLP